MWGPHLTPSVLRTHQGLPGCRAGLAMWRDWKGQQDWGAVGGLPSSRLSFPASFRGSVCFTLSLPFQTSLKESFGSMGVCRCGEGSQTLTPAEKLPGQCVRGPRSWLCSVSSGPGLRPHGILWSWDESCGIWGSSGTDSGDGSWACLPSCPVLSHSSSTVWGVEPCFSLMGWFVFVYYWGVRVWVTRTVLKGHSGLYPRAHS